MEFSSEVIQSLIRLAWVGSNGNPRVLALAWDELANAELEGHIVSSEENEYCEDIQLSMYDITKALYAFLAVLMTNVFTGKPWKR